MKKLLLNSFLFLTVTNVASAAVITAYKSDENNVFRDDGPTARLVKPCLDFFNHTEKLIEGKESAGFIELGCVGFLTTTSLPTMVIENPDVTVDSPETMAALINGDVNMANLVGLHFEVSGEKILETVAVMDETGIEVNLENIGNNL